MRQAVAALKDRRVLGEKPEKQVGRQAGHISFAFLCVKGAHVFCIFRDKKKGGDAAATNQRSTKCASPESMAYVHSFLSPLLPFSPSSLHLSRTATAFSSSCKSSASLEISSSPSRRLLRQVPTFFDSKHRFSSIPRPLAICCVGLRVCGLQAFFSLPPPPPPQLRSRACCSFFPQR